MKNEPMSEQDELLLTELGKVLYFDFEEYEVGSVAEVTWRENPRRQKEYKEKAKKLLTKVHQHYEQNELDRPKMSDLCKCGHPFEEHDWGAYNNLNTKWSSACLVEECDCSSFRLDRPESRKKIQEILRECLDDKGKYVGYDKGYVIDLKPYLGQILALIPDIEELGVVSEARRKLLMRLANRCDQLKGDIGEAKKPLLEELDRIRDEIVRLNKKLDDREKDLIESKREERERIEKEFIWGQVPYLDGDGTTKEWTMHCISDKDWQTLKEGK